MNDDLKKIIRQNDIIITLLGRIAFNKDKVKTIVTSKKKNPEKYVEGYNACDGNHSLSNIAEVVGVKPGTLSPILAEWEEIGIVREVEKTGGRFYKKLFSI